MITRDKEVVLTLARLYYVGRGKVVQITCRDPILVRVVLLDTSPAIQDTRLPFLERGFELLSDCVKVIFIKMRQNHNFETWKIEGQCFQESIIIPLNNTWSHSHLRQR